MKTTLTAFIFMLLLGYCFSQDNIRIMHYNLLYYGANVSFCTQTNNNLNEKEKALREIIQYVKPDIFCPNELSTNPTNHQRLLDSVFNVEGVTKYKKGTPTNYAGTIIGNGLFYNSEKLVLKKEYVLSGGARDINVYKLFYKSPDLSWSTDTVFLTVVTGHLESGNTQDDATKRDAEVAIIVNHLATFGKSDNYFVMGDFNLYTSDEPAFQRFITNSNTNVRFYDPVQKIGTWTSNSTFAAYHTQSTHATTTNTCPVGGGMDDRFDFILTTMPVLNGANKLKYVSESYIILGQDGKHFQKSILDSPTNTSAPSTIITDLYNLSDHLPVYMDLTVQQTPAEVTENSFSTLSFENPTSGKLQLLLKDELHSQFQVSVYNIMGIRQFSQQYVMNEHFPLQIDISDLPKGLKILEIKSANGFNVARKLLLY